MFVAIDQILVKIVFELHRSLTICYLRRRRRHVKRFHEVLSAFVAFIHTRHGTVCIHFSINFNKRCLHRLCWKTVFQSPKRIIVHGRRPKTYELLEFLLFFILLDSLFQKLTQPITLSLFAILLLFLSFYYFLSPYLSIILLYMPTYLGLPTQVYLPRSTYLGLPTQVYLPRSTYLGLSTQAYLTRPTYLGLPTQAYLPRLTYLSLPISTYSPLTTYQQIPTYVNLPTPINLHQDTYLPISTHLPTCSLTNTYQPVSTHHLPTYMYQSLSINIYLLQTREPVSVLLFLDFSFYICFINSHHRANILKYHLI